MSWIGADAESLKDNAQSIFKWTLIIAVGLGATYIIIKDPRVLGKWARLPLDAAKGTTKFIGGSIKTGTDAVLTVPRAIGVVKD